MYFYTHTIQMFCQKTHSRNEKKREQMPCIALTIQPSKEDWWEYCHSHVSDDRLLLDLISCKATILLGRPLLLHYKSFHLKLPIGCIIYFIDIIFQSLYLQERCTQIHLSCEFGWRWREWIWVWAHSAQHSSQIPRLIVPRIWKHGLTHLPTIQEQTKFLLLTFCMCLSSHCLLKTFHGEQILAWGARGSPELHIDMCVCVFSTFVYYNCHTYRMRYDVCWWLWTIISLQRNRISYSNRKKQFCQWSQNVLIKVKCSENTSLQLLLSCLA